MVVVMGQDNGGLGHGIEAAGPERPTTKEAADREPQAATRAVHLERFDCVAGAARREPAGRWATVERPLVPTHRGDQAAGPVGGGR